MSEERGGRPGGAGAGVNAESAGASSVGLLASHKNSGKGEGGCAYLLTSMRGLNST